MKNEALFIDSTNPGSDILPNKLMNIEKGIEISSYWEEFNHMSEEYFKENSEKQNETEKMNV